jgi:hypothetical protein
MSISGMNGLMSMTRRQFTAGLAAAGSLSALPSGYGAAAENEKETMFKQSLETLKKHLASALAKSKVKYSNGVMLHSPCVSATYRGIWPDDFLYPMLATPGIYTKEELTQIAEFLTKYVVDLERVPDRVEADGRAVMFPGAPGHPHGKLMPVHLPAAWVRLMDTLESWGAKIPRKKDWVKVIQRSVDQIEFRDGLVFIDQKNPRVGFGFHDTEAITGHELICSLVIHFGLQRAVRFFKDDADKAVLDRWAGIAKAVPGSLERLYDKEQGAFLAGSIDCRQVDVWANGLAYWLVKPEIRRKIVEYYIRNKALIFKHGCTRQIAEPGGWQRHLVPTGVGTYMNGGYWPVGTGWVLPVLADADPAFAAQLTTELVSNLEKFNFSEWINDKGEGRGAGGFIGSIAMPMMALTSIIEKKPFAEYF